jgi:putative component of toxin-antitoxin plasmid stabilization module
MEGRKLNILFGGGTKKTQKSDIKAAQKLFLEYKDRKKQLGKRKR